MRIIKCSILSHWLFYYMVVAFFRIDNENCVECLWRWLAQTGKLRGTVRSMRDCVSVFVGGGGEFQSGQDN